MASDHLFSATACTIEGQQKSGKVLAISISDNEKRACFQIEGERLGVWVPESSLILESVAEKRPKRKAKRKINSFDKFLKDIHQSLEGTAKSAADGGIEAVNRLTGETQKFVQNATDLMTKIGKDGFDFGVDLLTKLSKAIENFVAPIQKTLGNYADIWKKRLVAIIKQIDIESAKEQVHDLQKKYPSEAPEQIADRLMNEKTLYAILLGIGGLAPGGDVVMNWFATAPLLAELIYQISVCYGFNKGLDEAEIVGIFAIVYSGDRLQKLGVEFLKNNTPATGVAVSAIINVVSFQATCYAACKHYEAKVQEFDNPLAVETAYEELDREVENLVDTEMSEQDEIEKTVEEAMELKQELAIA
jgi:uncharacterized protein (DUF697 family)